MNIISTICSDVWYEIDNKNRIFQCSKESYNKLEKHMISQKESKSQAVKFACQLAKTFDFAVKRISY